MTTAAARAAASDLPEDQHSVAERLALGLRRHGVTTIFGQSIPPALILAAAKLGIRQVGYRAENMGGAMADGYARISGSIGVVTAQNGSAAALLVAPLAEALKASIPVLALVQDTPLATQDRHGFQELDQLEIFKGAAKWIRRVTDIARIDQYLDMAVTAAVSGRPGPAVLMVPQDVFLRPVGAAAARRQTLARCPLDRPRAAAEAVARTAALVADAEHPLVVAGGGLITSAAQQEVARLQELAALPVATTSMGKGAVDERHPLSLGVYSYFTNDRSLGKHMTPIVKQADLILLIGSRTNFNGTEGWTHYPEDATIVHIDIDPEEIGHNYESLRLAGDARSVLADLIESLRRLDLSKREAARPALESRIAAAKTAHRDEVGPLLRSDAVPLRPERLMAELSGRITAESVLVTDSSYAAIWVWNYITCLAPGMRFVTPRGLAGLGWGLPLAIGVKAAAPDRQVICIVGDGGFGHSWSEMETMVREGISFPVLVLNNGILGNQKHAENVRYGGYSDVCNFAPVDHAEIARGCGWQAERLERPEAIGPALDRALAADHPVLLDVICDERAYPPLNMYGDAPPEVVLKEPA